MIDPDGVLVLGEVEGGLEKEMNNDMLVNDVRFVEEKELRFMTPTLKLLAKISPSQAFC